MSNEHMTSTAVLDLLLGHLSKGPVLDAGCALGNMLKRLPPGSEGLEVSPEFVERCRAKGLKVRQQDLNQPLACSSGTYNSVLCSSVLEHIEAPIRLLKEFNRVLKPGGTLVLGLPRENWLIDWRRPYFRTRPYHLYAFTMRNIAHILAQTGFRVERFIFDPPFPGRRIGRWIAPLINGLPCNAGFLFCIHFWPVATKVAEGDEPGASLQANEVLVKSWLDAANT